MELIRVDQKMLRRFKDEKRKAFDELAKPTDTQFMEVLLDSFAKKSVKKKQPIDTVPVEGDFIPDEADIIV